ncbi:rhomboid family intramembrane serine protease [Roseobacter weihaiensis]|uniref:rhomboid family intramembrane serine protease n=1 Tax=Roseobacter weihaiensis TaxID=2763262 RepID=UPI001D0B0E63|nr:rhomboid family intramembrane serine protease [Roseobacter sp. H9]
MSFSLPALAPILRRYWMPLGLIAVCTVLEGILVLGDLGILATPRARQTAYEYGGFWPGLLDEWRPNYAVQPYAMFLTYAFLHSGPTHLIFNMVTLWSLAWAVIQRVGSSGFCLLYTGAVLGGAVGFGLLAETTRPMVGASGGLFGLAGGILAWSYIDRFSASLGLWPVVRAVAGLLVLNLVMWWLMDGLLAWETHLGGFVAGWVTALLVDPRSRPDQAE